MTVDESDVFLISVNETIAATSSQSVRNRYNFHVLLVRDFRATATDEHTSHLHPLSTDSKMSFSNAWRWTNSNIVLLSRRTRTCANSRAHANPRLSTEAGARDPGSPSLRPRRPPGEPASLRRVAPAVRAARNAAALPTTKMRKTGEQIEFLPNTGNVRVNCLKTMASSHQRNLLFAVSAAVMPVFEAEEQDASETLSEMDTATDTAEDTQWAQELHPIPVSSSASATTHNQVCAPTHMNVTISFL